MTTALIVGGGCAHASMLVWVIRWRGVLLAALGLVLTACAPPSASPAAPAPPVAAPSVVAPPGAARSSAAPAPTTTTYAGPALIDHVSWTSNSSGRSAHVFPTEAGRTAKGAPARAAAWQEVLRSSPQAVTASLHDQFNCHWDFARIFDPDKTSWDLEAWRPDVGYSATVAAGCNPGGPE